MAKLRDCVDLRNCEDADGIVAVSNLSLLDECEANDPTTSHYHPSSRVSCSDTGAQS